MGLNIVAEVLTCVMGGAEYCSRCANMCDLYILQASKVKLTIDLDVAAPHLIIPEDFTSQDSSLVCYGCAYIRVCLYLRCAYSFIKCAYI